MYSIFFDNRCYNKVNGFFYIQITKCQVDHFVPGRLVPFCQLHAKLTGQAACGAGTQGGAVRSKRTLQLFLDSTSFTATTSNNSEYVFIIPMTQVFIC